MNIVPFNFESNNIRVVVAEDSSILFVAKDVAATLGYKDTASAVTTHCRRAKSLKDIGVGDTPTLDPQTKLIPESDLYRLTLKSQLESAERFQDWVVEEVLPTIRKTGGYQITPIAPVESMYQKQLMMVKAASELLRLSDSSTLLLLNRISENEGLPQTCLPSYVKQPLARSLTYLLKSHGSSLNVRTANLALVDMGFVVDEIRTGQSGQLKKFKSITEAASKYGHNEVSPNNPRESQPLYHEDTFSELLALIEEHLSTEEDS